MAGGEDPLAPRAADSSAAAFDRFMRPFDPAKFRRAFDKLGRWINLRGGRKKGGKNKTMSEPNSAPPVAAPNEEPPKPPESNPAPGGTAAGAPAPDFSDVEKAAATLTSPKTMTAIATGNMTAETVISLIQTTLIFMGGADEGILADDEKAMLRPPLIRVLEKYKISKEALPPEVDLAMVIVMLVIIRVKRGEKTATFMAKVRGWFVGLWARQEGRKLASEVRREAQAIEVKP